MQAVDILSAQKPGIVEPTLELGEREMRSVGLYPSKLCPSLGVEFPDQRRILRPRFGACDVLESVAPPKASGISKRRHSTLRADPGPGKHEHGRTARHSQGLECGMGSNVGHLRIASFGLPKLGPRAATIGQSVQLVASSKRYLARPHSRSMR